MQKYKLRRITIWAARVGYPGVSSGSETPHSSHALNVSEDFERGDRDRNPDAIGPTVDAWNFPSTFATTWAWCSAVSRVAMIPVPGVGLRLDLDATARGRATRFLERAPSLELSQVCGA